MKYLAFKNDQTGREYWVQESEAAHYQPLTIQTPAISKQQPSMVRHLDNKLRPDPANYGVPPPPQNVFPTLNSKTNSPQKRAPKLFIFSIMFLVNQAFFQFYLLVACRFGRDKRKRWLHHRFFEYTTLGTIPVFSGFHMDTVKLGK